MRASRMLIATLKETPNEAVISSHVLLLRAGYIRKLVAGVYNYLPLGLRTLNKVEKVIREEMDASGALEILSSAIQPKELWEESGRWSKYGPELMRLKDRHGREFCLGPTHEEIFTDVVRKEVKSKKNLPMNIYQIQTKYRDEFRPRFGLMRSREFVMKDAYSFDTSYEGLDVSYKIMYDTYCRIFDRLHLKYKIVLADTGAIGGTGSHQFMALSDVGESDIIYCDCGYAADQEKASSKANEYKFNEKEEPLKEVETPNQKSIEEVSSFLNVLPKDVVKTMVYKDFANNRLVLVMVRGDRDVNVIKVVNKLNIAEHEIELASYEDIKSLGSIEGFVGPVGIKKGTLVLVDEEVSKMKNIVVGANKANYHLINVNFSRDFDGVVGEFRNAVDGDMCPVCGKPLKMERGIEIGQIFKLGTKYSLPMNCTFQDDDGSVKPMVMGCYGIGVTRTMSSIIEQNHDEFGIKWPLNVAPYHAVIVPISIKDETQAQKAEEMYNALLKLGVEVIMDDRDERPGFKFKDWELMGIPYIVTVGRRANEGICEFKDRQTMIKEEITFDEAISRINEAVKNM